MSKNKEGFTDIPIFSAIRQSNFVTKEIMRNHDHEFQ